MVVVVFPSPAGVGVIAVTRMSFPSGLFSFAPRMERSSFALALPYSSTYFSSIPAYPLTFESLFANGSATVSNLNITPEINDKSRVRYQASIVATVYLTDADGNTVTANGTLNFYQDVLLKVPTDFSEPYTIEVAVIARSRVGNLTAPNELSVRLCATIVTRVTQRREIVIPTYGDCIYPVCTTPSQNCSGLTALPTFTED